MTKDKTDCILRDFRRDKCEHCTKLCPHRIALHGLDGKSGRLGNTYLPADYRGITLANSPARTDQAENYVLFDKYAQTFNRGDVKSLYLWSESPGTGKTTTAAAFISEWVARDYLGALKAGEQPRQFSAYFLDINELQTQYNLATMTDNKDEMHRIGSVIKRTQEANFAVLDDIGVRGATEAFRSYVHAIINQRTVNGLPTIYTSNLPIEDMAKVFDERLYDRMRDQCAEFYFTGESRRGRR